MGIHVRSRCETMSDRAAFALRGTQLRPVRHCHVSHKLRRQQVILDLSGDVPQRIHRSRKHQQADRWAGRMALTMTTLTRRTAGRTPTFQRPGLSQQCDQSHETCPTIMLNTPFTMDCAASLRFGGEQGSAVRLWRASPSAQHGRVYWEYVKQLRGLTTEVCTTCQTCLHQHLHGHDARDTPRAASAVCATVPCGPPSTCPTKEWALGICTCERAGAQLCREWCAIFYQGH